MIPMIPACRRLSVVPTKWEHVLSSEVEDTG